MSYSIVQYPSLRNEKKILLLFTARFLVTMGVDFIISRTLPGNMYTNHNIPPTKYSSLCELRSVVSQNPFSSLPCCYLCHNSLYHTRPNIPERTAYRLLVGKRPLGKPRRRWMDNITINLVEIGWGGLDWVGMAQDRDQWGSLVNAVISLRVP
jgi:hypothetical protein